MRLVERRIGLLFAAFFLCFSVVLARALWLQGVRGGALASQASYQQIGADHRPRPAGHGVIDRRGHELAVSEDAASVYATPYQVKDPERTASRLAPLLDVSEDDLLKELTATGGFAYLARKVGRAGRGADQAHEAGGDRHPSRQHAAAIRRATLRRR